MAVDNLNRLDLWFTTDGDFIIDSTGDLRDTRDSNNKYESLRQTILHRILVNRNGWRFHPQVCAGLERFIGTNIDPFLLQEMERRIKGALTIDGFIRESDISIRTIDLGQGAIAILIYIEATGNNKPIVGMSYDITTGGITRVK